MRFICFITIALLLATSCSQVCTTDGMQACKTGRAIMYSCCTGTTFVEMNTSEALGKDIQLGDTTYHNAIQIVGRFEGNINVQLRAFNSDIDSLGAICYCLMAEPWVSLPMYVVESGSTADCSAEE